MTILQWHHYPQVESHPTAHSWLEIQANLGLAHNTIEAYGRALEDFLRFCMRENLEVQTATREHLARYVHDLTNRPGPRGPKVQRIDSGAGLSNATIQQRLTVVRLYYDFLMEETLCDLNPVGRGRFTPTKGFGGKRDRGLIPRYRKLPWIPNEAEWKTILETARSESFRNRVMMALAYDAGLRREELCSLETGDLDPAYKLIRVRAETTKNRQERIVPYSESTQILYRAYLKERRNLSQKRGPLFLSESRRNQSQPISLWTWSKVVQRIANQSGISQFTTHTFRHLCLTDLARAGWDIHEIALFAGHRSTQTTLLYIHLSGRELAEKLNRGMDSIHTWRTNLIAETLTCKEP